MRIEEKIHDAFIKSGQTLALAESCTGGAAAAALTRIAGASQFFLGSLVVYSNAWKEAFLGVSAKTLESKGAVSANTVEEMVQGLFARTECDFAAAISGIAGPSGGSQEKPVGTVFIAVAKRGEPIFIQRIQAPLEREAVIASAIQTTFEALLERVTS